MSVKISQLPIVSSLNSNANGSFVFPVVQDSETQIATGAQLIAFVSQNSKATVALSAAAPGNLTVPHSLGTTPSAVLIEMTSGGQFWFQTPVSYDNSALYLVASGGTANTGGAITGNAVLFI